MLSVVRIINTIKNIIEGDRVCTRSHIADSPALLVHSMPRRGEIAEEEEEIS